MKYLDQLMNDRHMTNAELSRLSGIPDSTLRDILSGKAQLDYCKAGTLVCLADALDTTVEDILEHFWNELQTESIPERKQPTNLPPLWFFYSLLDATRSSLIDHPELDLVRFIYTQNYIEQFYDNGDYRDALYLLGLTDYLIHKNHMEPGDRYDAYRNTCLDQPVYPMQAMSEDKYAFNLARACAEKYAIPELARFNIFLTEEDIFPDHDAIGVEETRHHER